MYCKKFFLVTAVLLATLMACTKDSTVPYTTTNIYYPSIEADASQLSALRSPYNAVMITGGYKNNGIILFRLKKEYAVDDFVAYDRTCPYEVDTSRLYWSKKDPMICKCKHCGTTFNLLGGYLEKGPAKYPPRKFNCQFVDGDLSIY